MESQPSGPEDSATMAELVRYRIYAGLDEIRDSTTKAKKMRDLVTLAEKLEDDDAVNAAQGALNGLAAAATS